MTTTPKGAWRITFLLFLFMLVNFADKVVVGLAGVPIMKELGLSPQQFGALGSAFFSLYSISAIMVGFVANRVAVRWILTVLGFTWAIVQFPMTGTVGLTAMVICRILLGIGEGPAASMVTHAIYKWFPDDKRTLPTAILTQGSTFGVIVAVPALNWVIVNFSWHHAFGVLGIAGLIWCVAWYAFGEEGPIGDEVVADGREAARIPYLRLLTCRTFIGSSLTTFGAYWVVSLAITWFTPFMVGGLGFSQKQAGWLSILPWIFGAVAVLFGGWISELLLARGASTRNARGVLGAAPLIIGGLGLLALPHVGASIQVMLLVLAVGSTVPIFAMCFPMLSEFTPMAQRGALSSIYCAFYSTAGIFAPFVMGSTVQRAATPLEGYFTGFEDNALILIAAGIAGLLLLWPNTEKARLAAADKATVQRFSGA